MKLLLVLTFAIFANCEFDPTNFDWTSVKPITQTKAYREAFPHLSAGEFLRRNQKVFHHREGRIIRGTQASPYDFPNAVGLILTFVSEQGWCSGSLISLRSVLTAGSCLVGNPDVTALLGASNILRIKQIVYVTSYIVHENFKKNLDNDIAILTLERDAELGPEIGIIRVPSRSQSSESFTNGITTTAGW